MMARKKNRGSSRLRTQVNRITLLTGPITQASDELYVYHANDTTGAVFTMALLESWGSERWRVRLADVLEYDKSFSRYLDEVLLPFKDWLGLDLRSLYRVREWPTHRVRRIFLALPRIWADQSFFSIRFEDVEQTIAFSYCTMGDLHAFVRTVEDQTKLLKLARRYRLRLEPQLANQRWAYPMLVEEMIEEGVIQREGVRSRDLSLSPTLKALRALKAGGGAHS